MPTFTRCAKQRTQPRPSTRRPDHEKLTLGYAGTAMLAGRKHVDRTGLRVTIRAKASPKPPDRRCRTIGKTAKGGGNSIWIADWSQQQTNGIGQGPSGKRAYVSPGCPESDMRLALSWGVSYLKLDRQVRNNRAEISMRYKPTTSAGAGIELLKMGLHNAGTRSGIAAGFRESNWRLIDLGNRRFQQADAPHRVPQVAPLWAVRFGRLGKASTRKGRETFLDIPSMFLTTGLQGRG